MKQLESVAQDSDVKEMLKGRQINKEYLELLLKTEKSDERPSSIPSAPPL
jgi:hypothetical protein